MIASLLALTLVTAQQGGVPFPEPALPSSGPIDHAPFFGSWGGLAMLSPERERWAVAVLEEVGPERRRSQSEGNNF